MSASASNLTPAQLHKIAIVLENESGFYRDYTGKLRASGLDYRELIGRWISRLRSANVLSVPATQWQDREQLRRYFHMTYELPAPTKAEHATVIELPTIEFWHDDARNPDMSLPDRLRPGMLFNTAWTKTITESMAQFPRYGKRWTDEERRELHRGRRRARDCTVFLRRVRGVLPGAGGPDMKIKTSELIGPALDWVVAMCEGKNITLMRNDDGSLFPQPVWADGLWQQNYSTNWAQGGPIIEKMRGIKLKSGRNPKAPCYAHIVGYNGVERWHQTGKTLLIAAMRCYVASKLGDEVDVPEELLT